MENKIEQILKERGERYGSFEGHANITQALKHTMHQTQGWNRLEYDQLSGEGR